MDAKGTAARFSYPQGIAVDSAGTVYVADTYNRVIRKIAVDGTVTTFAGLAGAAGSSDGQGGAARFTFPEGLARDGAGSGDYTLRKVSPDGMVTTIAGLAGGPGYVKGGYPFDPLAVTVDTTGNVYVADHFTEAVRKIDANGQVTTLAGGQRVPPYLDGPGNAVSFRDLSNIAVDPHRKCVRRRYRHDPNDQSRRPRHDHCGPAHRIGLRGGAQ